MRCPSCGDEANRVIDTRLSRDGEEIRRRRECEECKRRFTTRERVERSLPKIIKRDARREDYSREKLQRGLDSACVKRPVSVDALERIADRVERWLQERGDAEVASAELGERLMDELKVLDRLAAIRFASVFHEFESTDDYAEFIARLEADDEGGDE
ncbi:MAG: transcriptional repressor NrdR [Deltaproteobacteria bacterium]|nr:transcriptional repressor NrdR [Deltaproteobacteria bacterium]MBW2384644.1 transcriptional repressor NrdR [Deltaproteobacteria bacterium]MBW2696221.1 transcriptional repressor NrdR [Deltaproteobacteria bacterium]